MSEEEIIERLDYFEPDDLVECAMYRDCVEKIKKLIESQQKEIKNFKWKENEQKNLLKYKTDRIDKQQKEIEKNKKIFIQYEKRVNELEREIAINSISKDKIREKVIEVKNRLVKDEFITASQGKLNTIIDLQELLEERN